MSDVLYTYISVNEDGNLDIHEEIEIGQIQKACELNIEYLFGKELINIGREYLIKLEDDSSDCFTLKTNGLYSEEEFDENEFRKATTEEEDCVVLGRKYFNDPFNDYSNVLKFPSSYVIFTLNGGELYFNGRKYECIEDCMIYFGQAWREI